MSSRKRVIFDDKSTGGYDKVARIVDEANAGDLNGLTALENAKSRKDLTELIAAAQASIAALDEAKKHAAAASKVCKECHAVLTPTTTYSCTSGCANGDSWLTYLCRRCYDTPAYRGKPYHSEDGSIYYILAVCVFGRLSKKRADFDHIPTRREFFNAIRYLAMIPPRCDVTLWKLDTKLVINDESMASSPEASTGYQGVIRVVATQFLDAID